MNSINISDLLQRCDLALEAQEMVTKGVRGNIKGVQTETIKTEHAIIHRTTVLNEQGARAIGKQPGRYITLEVPKIRMQDFEANDKISYVFAKELRGLYNLNPNTVALVVGLGNWNVTPDALGPKVVSELFVTRHLYTYMPEVLEKTAHNVAAIAPGVLGITGVETGDIIKGVVDQVKPDVIFCVDALAANNIDRLSTVIQIADTGIHPGSGVGNKRKSISKESMGVPVIAIGVPTVVHAITLISNAVNLIANQRRMDLGPDHDNVIRRTLDPYVGALVVTPKEVDVLIEDIAAVISNGFNNYFHDHHA
ncbi:GPR endopeptidase [Clostridium sp. 'deep sea']|uniref:GPR endopeptidase n=1 Tax=Clostridium sp. 'deep sea' TaxID=2779445 RepID=UPI001896544B|nr:GPR endopeptidase [Clostridium sp. 'deep sea']QOR34340.1 GPR endopeptidase [Clostridium sp. 'deep sea']